MWAYGQEVLRGNILAEAPRHVKGHDSTSWKGICHGVELLNKGRKRRVDNGININFWKDYWIEKGPLNLYYTKRLILTKISTNPSPCI